MNRKLAAIRIAIVGLWLATFALTGYSQDMQTPLQAGLYKELTSYEQLSSFVQELDRVSDLVSIEKAGVSVQGRNIFALKFSSSGFGKDSSKIKILIFAQQHGNEPSGKEGVLMLAASLIKPENRYLLDKADILLVPQVNPDGGEAGRRRNGNGADLNRNHLILSEPETQALHRLYDTHQFEVTLDVHEYSPYGEAWKKYGYRSNSDEEFGCPTHPDVSPAIRDLAGKELYPYLKQYCADRKVSMFLYAPGGPPEIDYIRHSTFDINDGRQSLAIQHSFSFILEGRNAAEADTERIEQRARGQMTAMRGLIEYACLHKDVLMKLVHGEKSKLMHSTGQQVTMQAVHAATGEKLHLPLISYATGNDTVVVVNDYRPFVKATYSVQKPAGYLVPRKLSSVTAWIERQSLTTAEAVISTDDIVEKYVISRIDSIDFEGDKVVDPTLITQQVRQIVAADYLYIPTAQLKGNLAVIALEPKSMLGLATYPLFAGLLQVGDYPVLRVNKHDSDTRK